MPQSRRTSSIICSRTLIMSFYLLLGLRSSGASSRSKRNFFHTYKPLEHRVEGRSTSEGLDIIIPTNGVSPYRRSQSSGVVPLTGFNGTVRYITLSKEQDQRTSSESLPRAQSPSYAHGLRQRHDKLQWLSLGNIGQVGVLQPKVYRGDLSLSSHQWRNYLADTERRRQVRVDELFQTHEEHDISVTYSKHITQNTSSYGNENLDDKSAFWRRSVQFPDESVSLTQNPGKHEDIAYRDATWNHVGHGTDILYSVCKHRKRRQRPRRDSAGGEHKARRGAATLVQMKFKSSGHAVEEQLKFDVLASRKARLSQSYASRTPRRQKDGLCDGEQRCVDGMNPDKNNVFRATTGRLLDIALPRVTKTLPSDSTRKKDDVSAISRLCVTETTVPYGSELKRRLPGAIIIGAKKAGTRALLEYLRLHPDVRAAGPEPHFFDKNHYRGHEWYRCQMPLSRQHHLTIEKTPSYFVARDVPQRIRITLINTKLLLVVRDPVIRALSDYAQATSKGQRLSFFEMLFTNTSSGGPDTQFVVDPRKTLVRIGLYAVHFTRWLRYFKRENIHVVSGERLVTDPVGEVNAVQDFLGLKRLIGVEQFVMNATKGFPCFKRRGHSKKAHCLNVSKGRVHPAVHPELVERLRDFYRPFNYQFYNIVSRDFGWL
ncbi:uncharacterized protein LOC135383644 [Ornithodoros turicata]|uniref:uncharacterized protein LOC135383644 n=1 Tax=Ornithodoros turicata TaxID=34597 RepID=UPI003138F68D